jgi:hypothetical protein
VEAHDKKDIYLTIRIQGNYLQEELVVCNFRNVMTCSQECTPSRISTLEKSNKALPV